MKTKIIKETSRENTKMFFLDIDIKKTISELLKDYKEKENFESAFLFKQEIRIEAKKENHLDEIKIIKDIMKLFIEYFECDITNYTLYNNEYKKVKIKINRLDY